MIKSLEDVQKFSKEGFEAYTASAAALTKGLQTIAAETADFSRKSFEKNSQLFEKVAAVKSIDTALEVQSGFAREAYEAYVGQVTKLGEIYAAAAKDAFKPFESTFAQFTGKAAAAK